MVWNVVNVRDACVDGDGVFHGCAAETGPSSLSYESWWPPSGRIAFWWGCLELLGGATDDVNQQSGLSTKN